MKKTISILGCGWLGKALAVELIKECYSVKGSTTTQYKVTELKSLGIEPYLCNISEVNQDLSDFLNSDLLVIAITSKQSDDFKHLITRIECSPVKEIIFISSTSVYPLANTTITEEFPVNTSVLVDVETLIREHSKAKTTILRFGGLFGYDRQPGNFFKNNKIIQNPEGYINFIHRDDCIAIIEQLISQGVDNVTLNACSPSHPKRRLFYTQEFKKAERSDAVFNEESTNEYKIINSDKLTKLLGYTFKYDDLMNY